MENLALLTGLIVLSLLVVGFIWAIWQYVVGFLALIGLAQLYWVWRSRSGKSM